MGLRGLGVGAVVAALIGTTLVGTSVGATSALAATATPTVSRLAGADRIGTAVAISQHAFPSAFSSGGSVYLARMDVFADAVAAGTLTDGPVLLVPSCAPVPPEVKDEVARLAPARVVALGGAGAVCDQVLTEVAAGRTTARLAGADRYLTSLEIARERLRQGPVSEVYVASGLDSPDAVVGGQLTRGPILLTGTVDRSADYNTFIDEIDPAQVIALGGPGAVSDTQLALLHGPKARLAGNSRYETAAAIAHHQFPAIADAVYLARGDVFADAVAAGALKDGPVVLVASCALPFAAQTRVARALPLRVAGLGGQGAVCDDVLNAAAVAGTATAARISPVMPDQMGTLIQPPVARSDAIDAIIDFGWSSMGMSTLPAEI
jgi:putative cell wall-binding protein